MKFTSILILLLIISISLMYYNSSNILKENLITMKKEWNILNSGTPEECQNLAVNSNHRFVRTIKNLDETGKCWGSGENKVNAITTNDSPNKYAMWVNKNFNWNNKETQIKWCGKNNNNCENPDQCLSLYSENNSWFKLSGKNKINHNSCNSDKSGSKKNLLWWKTQKVGTKDGVPVNYIKMDYVKGDGINLVKSGTPNKDLALNADECKKYANSINATYRAGSWGGDPPECFRCTPGRCGHKSEQGYVFFNKRNVNNKCGSNQYDCVQKSSSGANLGANKGKCLSGEGKGLKSCGTNKTKIRIVPWNNIKKGDKILYKKGSTTGYAIVKEVQLNNCMMVCCPINSATDTKCRETNINLSESNILKIINYNRPITSSLRDVVQLKNSEGKCLGLDGSSPGWKCCFDPSTRYKPEAIQYRSHNPAQIYHNLGSGKWFDQGNHLVKSGNLNGMFVDNIQFQTLAYDKGSGDTNSKIRIKAYNKKGKEIIHKGFYPGRQKKEYKTWVAWTHSYCGQHKNRNVSYREKYRKKYSERYYTGRSCSGWAWWRSCWNTYGYRTKYKDAYRWKTKSERYCARTDSHPHMGGAWEVVGDTYKENKNKVDTKLNDDDKRIYEYKVFVNPVNSGNRIFLKYFKLNFYGYK